ncbi:flagellar hook-length control protein FliK [Variovorax sp. RA8]|uniref:flagellar hook-length control protein FliK n=1 Tax=Variovorax sp. (strain JCM 16519 / RA8) TaxID=662548 RepID=UPI001316A3B6|nr:flagellar hook-length control protein FliK [Variovorax sp. RA8]VTU20455.1 Flagellar hook-length control protein [Variovorax sp. RA8]
MPTFIPSAALPASSAQPAAQSGARGRPAADESTRSSFGAVLERSRAGTRRAQDGAEAASAEAAATPQKPNRHMGRKDEPGSELLTIALFAPQVVATAPAPTAADGAGTGTGTGMGKGGTVLPAAGTALPKDASLAAAAAVASTPGADASSAADEGARQDAKAPPTGPAVDTTTAAGSSAAPADKGLVLPGMPAASAEATVQPATANAPASALPLASALPSAKTPAAAGAAAASAPADTKAVPAASLTAGDATSVEAQPAILAAAAADTETASAPVAPPAVLAAASPMQPALDRAQPAASPAPAQTLAPPVGSAEWAPALGHQMLRMTAGGQQVAELNLNPAGLGPLKITLSVGDNQAQAMFVSAHESVRKAVEAALPQLRSTLAEQGISLGQTSVGAESRPWAGAGGSGQQQEQRQNASANGASYPGAGRSEAATTPLPARASTPSRTTAIDTFA